MPFNPDGSISSLNGKALKLAVMFIYLGSNISSTESDVKIPISKALTVIDRLTTIWKFDLFDGTKKKFFPASAVSILLYGCTTENFTKQLKKFCEYYAQVLHTILNKCLKQHPYKTALV